MLIAFPSFNVSQRETLSSAFPVPPPSNKRTFSYLSSHNFTELSTAVLDRFQNVPIVLHGHDEN